ncbi:PREDICTED: activator of 90 kDa heat shock protein ATPase homolog 1 [Papilio xuthus]|uniref:Activator of 90 kDa heat shock protein ATPase homolog 1 n=1 Tax=Papilio xuthus TaxID=66420 RepID=A0A194QEB3_PAPXU|nr:PREDICTED: activator of 90 kDa heat shock protein ATPase homolog 1 [Papilio xuthus]XP_013165858.1 PREDICTED: activator of 90 kDa heat shock protein ATPase homolog 1 [Papilio xuthus]KPJ03759.1 Activator of 90 kDa heat shock protein ATPase-like 1 [Papilio xuthus]
MAKWGEGDPRWIVEERPDATNVNNWHWTEKNAGPWSKDRLKELLNNLIIAQNGIDCKVTEVEKVDGEASANNRKGKLIFFYEWDIKLKWEGRLAGASELVKGEVHIPNLSEENDVSEVDMTVTIKGSGEEAQRVKSFMHNFGKDEIRKQLKEYIRSLKEEFSKGLILPKKGETSVKPDSVSTITSGFNKKINMEPVISTEKKQIGCKLDTKTIELTETFQCRAEEFYNAMTRIEMVTAFTQGHVKMDPEKGGKFALFGGNVTGEFKELVPGKKIVQYWRYKQWPEQHFSEVTFTIDEKDDHTLVTLKQELVPAAEVEQTEENWKRYYFNSIKRAFGFGAFL